MMLLSKSVHGDEHDARDLIVCSTIQLQERQTLQTNQEKCGTDMKGLFDDDRSGKRYRCNWPDTNADACATGTKQEKQYPSVT